MIPRQLLIEAQESFNEFKVVCITGPRQSGKTTLCKQAFKHLPYYNLEDPDLQNKVLENPRAFLDQFKNGVILDEVQRIPLLFSYIQTIVDTKKKRGQFVLSGSNNFLLQQGLSQSLAGRAAYIELLPFSHCELQYNQKYTRSLEKCILEGWYPDIVLNKTSPLRWFENYTKTYIERDVRLLRNVDNIILFNRFLRVCANRTAQILNVSDIARDIGVDHKTIQSWLSVLQASYIIFLLPPYHTNFNKRVTKSPKLYFYDTGLASHLMGLKTITQLKNAAVIGPLFENLIVAEIKKNRLNKTQSGEMYFFRDNVGNEVDLILEKNDMLLPVEIKSSKKFNPGMLKNLTWWQRTSRQENGILCYAGENEKSLIRNIELIGWNKITDL